MMQKGYEHNMIKEIMEEPAVIYKTLEKNKKEIERVSNNILRRFKGTMYLTGSGTSFHALLSFQYLFFQLSGTYATAIYASEFPLWVPKTSPPSIVLAVSQSGESLDVINAVKWADELKFYKVGLTNRVGSQLSLLCDDILYTYAGEEKALAATKTYVTQLIVLLTLATDLSHLLGRVQNSQYHDLIEVLENAHDNVRQAIEGNIEKIETFAKEISYVDRVFVLGSGLLYPSAVEGSLKVKETCTIPSEGFALREFLHGPIQLTSEKSLTIILGHSSIGEKLYADVINRIKNFGGKILFVNDRLVDFSVDEQIVAEAPYIISPIVYAPMIQVLAYYLSLAKGLNPDSPEKLSKVVK
ncbi:MAG: SIS domain-containing protein [Nitrososphaeria archaeon]|nr:SIS domain-containing protein [Nitrososphaeria archaeon]